MPIAPHPLMSMPVTPYPPVPVPAPPPRQPRPMSLPTMSMSMQNPRPRQNRRREVPRVNRAVECCVSGLEALEALDEGGEVVCGFVGL